MARYGVYSLFPSPATPAPTLYQHQPRVAPHPSHKISDSLFSTGSYTFGSPTPPPGSPFSPLPVAQLELLAKNLNTTTTINQTTNSIIVQQHTDFLSGNICKPGDKRKDPMIHDRRWERDIAPLSIKTERCKKSCMDCIDSPEEGISGCSRTLPVSWSSPGSMIQVKREPMGTPCQVAEVTTSNNPVSNIASIVKMEVPSPKHENNGNAGSIPVGIAVARQRLQQEITPITTMAPNHGLINSGIGQGQSKDMARLVAEMGRDHAAMISTEAMTVGLGGGHIGSLGPTLLHCGDDRGSMWPMSNAQGAIGPPTLWQYPDYLLPATPMPMESMMPLPMPPVGFQLVRDPTTGHFLLLPTAPTMTGLEPFQQTVVWPSYQQTMQPPPHLLLPPPPLAPLAPMTPLQLLSSDYLTTASTTLHQHTQTHSTRLVALTSDPKRKQTIPLPGHTLIKIEADCGSSQASILDQCQATACSKAMSVSSVATTAGAIFTDSMTPVVTTHLFYQHPGNLIQIGPGQDTMCHSQATSPVSCLTPPPEIVGGNCDSLPEVQDASNQTDTPVVSEDDNTCMTQILDLPDDANSDNAVQSTKSFILSEESNTQLSNAPSIVSENLTFTTFSSQTDTFCAVNIHGQTFTKTENFSTVSIKPSESLMNDSLSSGATITEIFDHEDENSPEESSAPVADMENVEEQTKSVSTSTKPDLSGLVLLSNSIEQFETVRKSLETPSIPNEMKKVDTPKKANTPERQLQSEKTPTPLELEAGGEGGELGSFDILCALAEQRFMEEVVAKSVSSPNRTDEKVLRKKHKRSSEDGNKYVEIKLKRIKNEFSDDSRSVSEQETSASSNSLLKRVNATVKRDLVKELTFTNGDKSVVVAKHLDCVCKIDNNQPGGGCQCSQKLTKEVQLDNIQLRLADLERQYRETLREMSKLAPGTANEAVKPSSSPPPPLLDRIENASIRPMESSPQPLTPPKLSVAVADVVQTVGEDSELSVFSTASLKRAISPGPETNSDSAHERVSSSKKRKVGRPKKHGNSVATETIFAKKPKSKSSLVGYLLNPKSRLNMPNKGGIIYSTTNPPRPFEENGSQAKTKKESKVKPSKQLVVPAYIPEYKYNSDGTFENNVSDNGCNIRPKLKAETKIKTYSEEDDLNDWTCSEVKPVKRKSEKRQHKSRKHSEKTKRKKAKKCEARRCYSTDSGTDDEAPPKDTRCVLTAEHLDEDNMRVLTAMGGLFYAGRLSAVQAPDVYAVTLDGERGNRPHILSREEILRDAIVEVCPGSVAEVTAGTRLCAYWSQQYRCLYPGTAAEPGTPDPQLDGRFVSVEFDDGDSGRIAIEDIRLLQPDYPIVEYDPNPLLTLGKRRRRTSANSSERLSIVPTENNIKKRTPSTTTTSSKDDETKPEDQLMHRERKRMKKHKKDKLKRRLSKNGDEESERKRKKKHRCCDEHCKHRRHHKKHRKHKRHHHSSSREDSSGSNREECATKKEDIVRKSAFSGQLYSYEKDSTCAANSVEVEDEPEVVQNEDCENDTSVDSFEQIEDVEKKSKVKKGRERTESVESSKSRIAPFLPARQLWDWSGKGYRRAAGKGRARKLFYKAIHRNKEIISVGDCAVFLSTGRPDRPYIGHIEALWESGGNDVVRVKWFYHPEETEGCPENLKYPGALFESPHADENDVQTISHKCEVLPLPEYTKKIGDDLEAYASIYDNNDTYYLAGHYEPGAQKLTMALGIPLLSAE